PKKPPSFSHEEPNTFVQPSVPFSFDHERWSRMSRELSSRFNSVPRIFDSEVRIFGAKASRLLVSTEGTRIVTEEMLYGIHVSAVTRADDGQLLDNTRDFYAPTENRLPNDVQLFEAVEKLISELLALRQAPAIDPYTGPAILESAAAGVLFHEAVGHRLE